MAKISKKLKKAFPKALLKEVARRIKNGEPIEFKTVASVTMKGAIKI